MITLTLSRDDAALLYRRLEDARRLSKLTLDELVTNLPDGRYSLRLEQTREDVAHLDRVLQAIRDARKDAQKGD